ASDERRALTPRIVSKGRWGSLSPSGPVSMASVISWAKRTDEGGAATITSTREAVGNRKWVTGIKTGLVTSVPSCVFTGTPSMLTTYIGWAIPSKTYCRSRMVSDAELQMRRSSGTPVGIERIAGTQSVPVARVGDVIGT